MALKQSGGLFSRLGELFKRAYYLADIREGTLVGTDRFGNQYYQAQDQKKTQWGKERWILPRDGDNYDASEIPAEWHMWLHHISDVSPAEQPPKPLKFAVDHDRNRSGDLARAHFLRGHFLNDQFKPFDTKEKVRPWAPEAEALKELDPSAK